MASSGMRKCCAEQFDTLGVWVFICPELIMDIVVNGDHIGMAVVIAIGL